jgi:hypothetical protein
VAVAVAALAQLAGPALGIDTSAVDSVSVPQLQTTQQLPQTPDASVPVPAVPQVQTPSVPSVPQVSAPSVPSTPQVGTPSASVPSPGQSSQSATGSSGPAPTSASSSASSSPAAGSSRRSARIAPARTRAQARARHQARERRVQSEVRRLSGCLDSLDDLSSRFLSLRAGLEGRPLSRGAAARELGIPRADARGVERRGLRALRDACGAGGAGGGSAQARTVAQASHHMPQLQPAGLLVATGGAAPTQFVDQRVLGKGRQQVKGEQATSPAPSPSSSGPAEAAAKPLASATSDGLSGAWIAVVAALALMTAVALVALRARRAHPAAAVPAENLTAATAVAAAPRAPAPAPEAESEPEPEAEAPPEPERPATTYPAIQVPPQPAAGQHRNYSRAARPAAMIASGVISFVARELVRRRSGGRRRR